MKHQAPIYLMITLHSLKYLGLEISASNSTQQMISSVTFMIVFVMIVKVIDILCPVCKQGQQTLFVPQMPHGYNEGIIFEDTLASFGVEVFIPHCVFVLLSREQE